MIRAYLLAGPTARRSAGSARKIGIVLFLCVVATALTAAVLADKKPEKRSAEAHECDVENFGKVTDFYYRGAQPEPEEYEQLAAIGVRTIIDLRDDPKEYAKEKAELAGMRYLNLPMSDKRYPAATAADRFLDVVNDRANWPVFVHCAGGRHRTGAMTAVFRMTNQGWDIEQAYDEMKDYDFYTRWGHKPIKQYVYDYYRELTRRRYTQSAGPTR